MTRAGARLVAEEFRELAAYHVTVILSGIKRSSPEWKIIGEWTGGLTNIRNYYLLDAAIEWAEDQVVYRYGGAIDFHETTELSEQPLLAGLTAEELTDLASLATIRTYRPARRSSPPAIPPLRCSFCAAAWCTSPCPTASGWRR